MNNDTPDGTCYICGHGNTDVIQRHHIIPRRYSGSDKPGNLVPLCPTCHDAIERIYDDSFFEKLGVEKIDTGTEIEDEERQEECQWRTCSAEVSHRLESGGHVLHVCEGHRECQWEHCTQIGSPIPVKGEDVSIACNDHRTCYHEDCLSRVTTIYDLEYSGRTVSCESHTDDLAEAEQEAARQERIEKRSREYSRRVKDTIHNLQRSMSSHPGASVERVYAEFEDEEITEGEIDHIVQKFRDKGEVYSPDQNHLRVV